MLRLAVQSALKNVRLQTISLPTRGYAAAIAGQEMTFTFASPGQVFYNGADVKQIDVPSFSGAFGILPKHVPILASLKPGIVTVFEDSGATKKFFVSSGTVTVNEDSSVQLMAEEACNIADLDLHAIRDGLTKANTQLHHAKDEKERAEAEINIEVHEAMAKAVELGI